jgi:hypothetical protein
VDEETRRRWKRASLEDLERARESGELTEEDYHRLRVEYYRARSTRSGLRIVLLVLGFLGLGALIFCGGCGLILTKPWQGH